MRMANSQELRKTCIRPIMQLDEADTSVKDLMNFLKDNVNYGSDWLKATKYSQGSIARRAAQLVLTFPVIVSSSLKLETAIIISKALEKKMATLLQLLFSASNLNDFHDTRDLHDYISKFHTNLDSRGSSITLDDFITAMDTYAAHTEGFVIDNNVYTTVMEELREINTAAKDWFREDSVNDYVITKDNMHNYHITNEATGGRGRPGGGGTGNGGNNNGGNQNTTPPQPPPPYVYGVTMGGRSGGEEFSSANLSRQFSNQIINGNMDKANELLPTMMVVNFVTTKDSAVINRSGVVGVKCKLYPVDSSVIIAKLSSKYADSNTLFSLIRASTREKSFFKDLALAFEKTKMDAINIAKDSPNAKLFHALERRARRNKRILLNKGDASPITTLVITQEEVEYLKKYANGLDIEKLSTAKTIMDGYNLIGLVIADASLEIAKFLIDDGSGIYETITYDALEREDRNQDYKKIVNLLARTK